MIAQAARVPRVVVEVVTEPATTVDRRVTSRETAQLVEVVEVREETEPVTTARKLVTWPETAQTIKLTSKIRTVALIRRYSQRDNFGVDILR